MRVLAFKLFPISDPLVITFNTLKCQEDISFKNIHFPCNSTFITVILKYEKDLNC